MLLWAARQEKCVGGKDKVVAGCPHPRFSGEERPAERTLFPPSWSEYMHSPLSIPLVFGFSLYLSGCTSTVPAVSSQGHFLTLTENEERQKAVSLGRGTGENREVTDAARLAQLWDKRKQATPEADYPLGPGDVLEISVPRMEELAARTVRVSGEGTIALPFAGVMEVNGLTEREVKEEIRQRLVKYKRDPQVSLFVREYRSRLVAVAGAVEKPGLYNVSSTRETLLDVISQAGGMTKDALPQILLLPAESAREVNEGHRAVASLPTYHTESVALSERAIQSTDPLVIDLQRLRKGKNQLYLTLPVRPGDAVIVPSGGEILVGGWVDKPGSYKVTPGLTVLGAVTAAGDTLFPADTKAVKVIRTDVTGEKNIFSANLQEIARGESPDIPVQEGDVIEVNPSTMKLVSYGMFNFFRSVFTIGAQMRPY